MATADGAASARVLALTGGCALRGGATGSSPAGSISWAATEADLADGAGGMGVSAGGRTWARSTGGTGLGRTAREAGAEAAGTEGSGTGGAAAIGNSAGDRGAAGAMDSGRSEGRSTDGGSGTRAPGVVGAGALGDAGARSRGASAIVEPVEGSATAAAAGDGNADGRARFGGGEDSGSGSGRDGSSFGNAVSFSFASPRAVESPAAGLADGAATREAMT